VASAAVIASIIPASIMPIALIFSVPQLTTWVLRGRESTPTWTNGVVSTSSAPVGIPDVSLLDVKHMCKSFIESRIRDPEYAAQCTTGNRTKVPFWIFEVVKTYRP
jgi:hypothetical protein